MLNSIAASWFSGSNPWIAVAIALVVGMLSVGAFTGMTFVPLLQAHLGTYFALCSSYPLALVALVFISHARTLAQRYRPMLLLPTNDDTQHLWTVRKFPKLFFLNVFVAVNSIGMKYLFLTTLPNVFHKVNGLGFMEIYFHIGTLGYYGFIVAPIISAGIKAFQQYVGDCHAAYAIISIGSTGFSASLWLLYALGYLDSFPLLLIHGCYFAMPFTETSKISAAYRTIETNFISLGSRFLSFCIYVVALMWPLASPLVQTHLGFGALIWLIVAWNVSGFVLAGVVYFLKPKVKAEETEIESRGAEAAAVGVEVVGLDLDSIPASPAAAQIRACRYERQHTYCEKRFKQHIESEPNQLSRGAAKPRNLAQETFQRKPDLEINELT